MKVKVIIVDDEAPARSEMRYLLDRIEGVEVLGEAGTAAEALKLIHALDYDIAFLDIDMPGMNGIEMVGQMKKLNHKPAVIFTTAYGQFAVKAFEVNAADYLLKPIIEERLVNAITKVKSSLKNGKKDEATGSGEEKKKLLDRIPVTKQSKTFLLYPEEIFFIESHGEFAVVNSVKGKFMSSIRLKEFEQRLSAKSFFRSHRSYIVNLDHVHEMISLYGGLYMLKMDDQPGSEVPVSRRQTRKLKSLLGI